MFSKKFYIFLKFDVFWCFLISSIVFYVFFSKFDVFSDKFGTFRKTSKKKLEKTKIWCFSKFDIFKILHLKFYVFRHFSKNFYVFFSKFDVFFLKILKNFENFEFLKTSKNFIFIDVFDIFSKNNFPSPSTLHHQQKKN